MQRTAVADFHAILLDVRSEADWHRTKHRIETEHGGLDVLVNNAGIHRPGRAEDTTADLWNEIMAVNLWGTFLGCRTAISLMRQRGGGAIVNLSSIAGLRGVPGSVAYNTSKGGICALTMALAADHAGDQIRVNCVCPGAVETPIIDQIVAAAPDPDALRAMLVARHPMGRLGRPEEVAAVIAFLASDDASFMTGVALPVDSGRSAR
jgi:NAD(P)-dependent dehydrogenase (short-subunit alcohol dehydrogenase family)